MAASSPRLARIVALACLLLGCGLQSPGVAHAGDSLYGTVTEVRSPEVVRFDYGAGQYELRLIGIDVPSDPQIARQAVEFMSNLVLGKNVRMRFEYRTPNGEMLARLFTDDPVTGIQEVGVELVRAGLARPEAGFDLKYGELAEAEREAQSERRGLWAAGQPR